MITVWYKAATKPGQWKNLSGEHLTLIRLELFQEKLPYNVQAGLFVLLLSSCCAFILVPFLLPLSFNLCHIFYCMMIALSRNLMYMKVWSHWSTYKRPFATRQTKVYTEVSL